MLVSFQVGNFRSFANAVTLSGEALSVFKEKSENVASLSNGFRLLRVAGVYGANASGKSNLFNALFFMRSVVLKASRLNSTDTLPVNPFRLDSKYLSEPAHVEVTFTLENVVYRYGFRVTAKMVVAEWLFRSSDRKHKEKALFTFERNDAGVSFSPGKALWDGAAEVRIDLETVLPNVLLLSRLDQLNNPAAKQVMGWFSRLHILYSGLSTNLKEFSAEQFLNGTKKERLLAFLRIADPSIKSVSVEKKPIDLELIPAPLREFLPEGKREHAEVFFTRMNADGEPVSFSLEKDESDGTAKMFCLSGVVSEILDKGEILFIDELEARLHPKLTRYLVTLFNRPETNPNNAQLIFATHETNLLVDAGLLRDQIWFCEKTPSGATDLYSLGEIRGVRKEAPFEKDYLLGKYGALPFFDDAEALFSPRKLRKEEAHGEE